MYGQQHPSSYVSPFAYEEITIDQTIKQPDPVKRAAANMAYIIFQDGPIVLRVDGTDPAANLGIPVYDGDKAPFGRYELETLRMTRQGVTNGIARITYYK